MRTPPLTYEVILTALTLGAIVSETGCSKASPVRAEPAPAANGPAATATPTAIAPAPATATETAPGAAAAAPSAAAPAQPAASGSGAVRAQERKPPSAGAPRREDTKTGGSAACGGSSCSPDMKKGN